MSTIDAHDGDIEPVNPLPATSGTKHPSIPDVLNRWRELDPTPINPPPHPDGAGAAAKTGR